jgi:hypothetical protein
MMNSLLKITILAILISSCGKKQTTTGNMPCVPTVLAGNIIAFYPFANGSLKDESGNNQDLANYSTAAATSDRNGNPHCAYAFNNTSNQNEYLIRQNPAFLNNLSEMSVSLWYELTDSTSNGASYSALISRDTGERCPNTDGQWAVGIYDCSRAVFAVNNDVWDNLILPHDSFTCKREVTVRLNSWHHVVATYVKSTNEISIYRDGVLQSTKTTIGDCGNSGNQPIQDVGNLIIGRHFTGKIDDIILFNKKLNQQEINTLYNMTTCCME